MKSLGTKRLVAALALTGLFNMWLAIPGRAESRTAFTPEELETIERQMIILEASGSEREGPARSHRFGEVIQKGGSGRDRWAVFDAGTDRFGNRYAIDTRLAQPLGKTTIQDSGGAYVDGWLAQFVLEVYFAEPAARDGVAIRHVVMEVKCPRRPLFEDHDFRRLLYFDYDENDYFIARHELNEESRLVRSTEWGLELSHLQQGCQAAYIYPYFVELLVRAENPTGIQTPTPYERDREN